MDAIIEQLIGYCDCFKELTDLDEQGRLNLEKNLMELIHLVSNMTCWNGSICDTFLNGAREEILDAKTLDACRCDGALFEVAPFFTPFDPETLEIYWSEVNGIKEDIIKIDPEKYAYIESLGTIRIDLSEFASSCQCGCKPTVKIKLVYQAGYELLPDCLLPIFCDLLHVIYAKNSCNCDKCQACNNTNSTAIPEIEYADGDEVTPVIETYLNTLIANGYKTLLGQISLCGNYHNHLWGCVI